MISWFRRQDVSVQLVVILTALLVLWLGSGLLFPAEPQLNKGRAAVVPEVPVVRVVPEPHGSTLVVNGASQADDRIVIAAEVAGQVARVRVAAGDQVKRGDLLLELEVAERQAQAAAAQANLANARQQLESGRALAEAGYLAAVGLTQREAAFEAARQQAEVANKQLADTQVRAPRSGVVTEVAVRAGDYVAVGNPVATLVGGEKVLLVGEVSQDNLGEVAVGQEISATLPDGTRLAAVIRYVARDASAGTRTYRLEAEPLNMAEVIPTGMSVRLLIPRAEIETAALVSHTQLVLADGGGLAMVGLRGGAAGAWQAELLPVRLQEDSMTGAWVLGLPPEGAWVVSRGAALLAPGSPVSPTFLTQGGA